MIYSVLTPTYNRAHTLTKVYTSLQKQTLQDFEWIIVDDGSTDHTSELVEQWRQEATFPIRYFKQPNGGHHVATNRAIQEAQGKFCLPLDSDDQLIPQALERFLNHWEMIPEPQRDAFVGVTALIQTESGQLMGNPFPEGIYESNAVEIGYVLRLGGDRKGMLRTDVLKHNLYPVFEDERFISDSIIWHRIAAHYKTRCVNDVLCISDYLPDGQTLNTVRLLCKNAKGSALYYQELSGHPYPLPFTIRIGAHAYYVRYALHARYPWKTILSSMKQPRYRMLGILAGNLIYMRDRLKGINSDISPRS